MDNTVQPAKPIGEMLDTITSDKRTFTTTRSDAHARNICVRCGKPADSAILRNETEVREYRISAMCGPCWDWTFSDDED